MPRPRELLLTLLMVLPAVAAAGGTTADPGAVASRCLAQAPAPRNLVACPGLSRALAHSRLRRLLPVPARGPYPAAMLRDLQQYARDYRAGARGPEPDPGALAPILARLRPPPPPGPPGWLVQLDHWFRRHLAWVPWQRGLRWLRGASAQLHLPPWVPALLLDLAAALLLAGAGWLLIRLLGRADLAPAGRRPRKPAAATGRFPDGEAASPDHPGTWLTHSLARLAAAGLLPPPRALSNGEVVGLLRTRAPRLADGVAELARAADAVSFGERELPAAELERLRALACSLGEASP